MSVATKSTDTRGADSPVPGPLSPGLPTCPVRNPFAAAARRSPLCAATIITSSGRRFSAAAVPIAAVEELALKVMGHVEDVNNDDFFDMVFHFNTQDIGIACNDTMATLSGRHSAERHLLALNES